METDHWGLIVLIAFLLGMGTPYAIKRNGNGAKKGLNPQLDQIFDLLALLTDRLRDPTPPDPEDPEDGSP